MHAEDVELPDADSELAGQFITEFPPVQKLFAVHGMHVPPLSPKYPGLQLQSVILPLPTLELELSGHVYTAWSVQYVFAWHIVHTPSFP